CISRTSFDWGIPVPIDPKHVIYVWFDALTNYLTPIGFLDDPEKFNKYWPANLHLVGKEIVRFHTIIWPCILMALDLPLPKKVYGHGWLIVDGDKMSKSKGNVVDPIALIDEFGADAIRYFLLREINLGQDGNFSRDALIQRINSDLANDLGNLLHRTLNMIGKFQDGIVLAPQGESEIDASLKADAAETVQFFDENMQKMELSLTIKKVWAFISRANKYIDETAPWALAKEPEKKQELANVMYNLVESLRHISVLIAPFMPITAERIWQQLNLPQAFAEVQLDDIRAWGGTPADLKVGTPEQLFPRIEVEKEEQPAKQPKANKQKKEKKADKKDDSGEVTFDEFSKLQLRVAKVLAAEKIPETDKLLKLKVDLGSEQRELVSGIANHYEPSELIGKNVVMVANLKPAKIRGVVSHGMVLAASQGDDLKVVSVDMPVGAVVK
ncbi:MAG: methionine--tRNA ligase, partial [Selenomonas sp.]|nr:methionine--tRNA ligase [Selenomonas sp.]